MTSATRRNRLGALAWLLMFASAPVARAQAPDAAGASVAGEADTEAGREYRRTVAAAVDEFQQGHFAQARALFERAHRISPSARTLRGMSYADFESQHYALALSEIEAALADPRKPLDVDQRREAEEFLARVQPLVGSVRARVTPLDAALFVNGARTPNPVRLDPGNYVVSATAGGYAQAETSVTIEAGQQSDVELTLMPMPRQPDTSVAFGTQRKVALVVGGVGVAAVLVGSIFGIRSIVKHNESDDLCSGSGACRDQRGVEAMDDARVAGNVATAAWIIGGLGLAGAGVLWFTVPERASVTANKARVGIGVAALQLDTRW